MHDTKLIVCMIQFINYVVTENWHLEFYNIIFTGVDQRTVSLVLSEIHGNMTFPTGIFFYVIWCTIIC